MVLRVLAVPAGRQGGGYEVGACHKFRDGGGAVEKDAGVVAVWTVKAGWGQGTLYHYRLNVVTEEGGGSFFVDLAGGDSDNKFIEPSLISRHAIPIDTQERARRDDCRALVAVNKCVVSRDAKHVSGGKFLYCSIAVMCLVFSAGEGRLQRILVTQALCTSVSAKLLRMHGFDSSASQKLPSHSASF